VLSPQDGGRSLFDDILDDAKKHVIFSHTKSLNDLYVYFWRWAIWKVFEENSGPCRDLDDYFVVLADRCRLSRTASARPGGC
jgi:hypothetical protein